VTWHEYVLFVQAASDLSGIRLTYKEAEEIAIAINEGTPCQ